MTLLPPLARTEFHCTSLEEILRRAANGEYWAIRLVHPNRMVWYEMSGRSEDQKVTRFAGSLDGTSTKPERSYSFKGALLKLRGRLSQGFKAVDYGHSSHRAPDLIDPLAFVESVRLVEQGWQGYDKEGQFLCDLPLETVLSLADEAGVQLDLQSLELQPLR